MEEVDSVPIVDAVAMDTLSPFVVVVDVDGPGKTYMKHGNHYSYRSPC